MKRLLFFFFGVMVFAIADTTLIVKKGWQMIGSGVGINTMSIFPADKVIQVWSFDATTQQWQGYSIDKLIAYKMQQQNIEKITSLKAWQGIWVYSSEAWSLVLPETKPKDVDMSGNRDTILLEEGWNLVSLPVNMVVSPKIFEGMTLWKYNLQSQWEFYDSSIKNISYTPTNDIVSGEGFWVKSPTKQSISLVEKSSTLSTFASDKEMQKEIKSRIAASSKPMLYYTLQTGVVDDTKSMQEVYATATNTNASQTNIQVEGVDESDILKNDNNTTLYHLLSDKKTIAVYTFERLAQRSNEPIATIKIDDNRIIDSFYLLNQRLVVLSQNDSMYTIMTNQIAEDSGVKSSYINPASPQFTITFYDVSDNETPLKIAEHTIDGSLFTSRLHDGILYTVSRFSPNYKIDYPKIKVEPSAKCKNQNDSIKPIYANTNENKPLEFTIKDSQTEDSQTECSGIFSEEEAYYYYDYDNPTITFTTLLPRRYDNEGNHTFIDHTTLYASANQKESTAITALSAFDISNGDYLKSNAYIGEANHLYASTNALYLVNENYPFYYTFGSYYQQRSTLYKFALDANLSYQATGKVWGRLLNQYAMDEYNNTLRIASTQGFSWSGAGTKNSLYTLQQDGESLDVKGTLESLGEKDETIYGVRFVGERGYVVTFKQTDPLYVLNLSDPTSPYKTGELKIDGYSDYLHPIGADLLLGIGRDADDTGATLGVKIVLFNINPIYTNPKVETTITLPKDSYSTIGYDPKAFVYRPNDTIFGVPYVANGVSSLALYAVENNTTKPLIEINATINASPYGRAVVYDWNKNSYVTFFAGDLLYTSVFEK